MAILCDMNFIPMILIRLLVITGLIALSLMQMLLMLLSGKI